jgi:glycosyltransferase involved in cell wall biosynthesis
MADPSLALVVPAFNEARRLGKTLPLMIEYLSAHQPSAELIVVDDGSRDGTAEVATANLADETRVAARVIRFEENRGKGHAVRKGLLATRAPIAIFSDADLSTPISELPKIVDPIRAGDYDVVFGSRALNRKLLGQRQPWHREYGGRIFNYFVRWGTGLPFFDTQCGFKAFRMNRYRPLLEQAAIDGFGFDVELLFLARQADLRLLECPVRWDHNEGSKVDLIRDSMRMLHDLGEIRRRFWSGHYNAAISAAKSAAVEGSSVTPISF